MEYSTGGVILYLQTVKEMFTYECIRYERVDILLSLLFYRLGTERRDYGSFG